MMRLFHLSPVGQLLAAMRGTGVAELVPDPEPEPVAANDADDEQWGVICWDHGGPLELVVVHTFPTEAAAERWAGEHAPNGEIARLVTPAEFLGPGSAAP
jgi:hypothetical protein